MMTGLRKSFILTAAIAAPLYFSANAVVTTTSNKVNQHAENQFTNSIKDALSAYDSLERGNMAAAKSKLGQAIRSLETAMAQDFTLGFSHKSGNAFRNDLNMIKTKLNSGDKFQVKSEFNKILSSAGIISGL